MNVAAIAVAESRAELTRVMRLPAYVIPTVAFPLAFYTFFGLLMAPHNSPDAGRYMLASFGAFGVIGASLFGFGVGVAVERGQGWMQVKRASPLPPVAYLTAKLVAALTFAAIIVCGLSLLAITVGGVHLTPLTWLGLAAALVFGAIPFCALGLFLGWFAGPNSAAPIVNLIYLPLSFLGGLWIPIGQLPEGVAHIAVWLPTYHLGQLALGPLGFGRGNVPEHLGALLAWGAVGTVAAVLAMKADEGKTYG